MGLPEVLPHGRPLLGLEAAVEAQENFHPKQDFILNRQHNLHEYLWDRSMILRRVVHTAPGKFHRIDRPEVGLVEEDGLGGHCGNS